MKQKSLRKRVSWHTGIRSMLTNAAAIHYTTKGEQQAVEESLSLNHGVVVPLGVEMKSIQESATAKRLSDQFPALEGRPYVLVLSRLHPKKALEVLLGAFLSLVRHAEFQDWRLVLAGEGAGDYIALLKQMVAEQGAGDFVVFTGWLNGEKKEAALRDASLLALPSHHENFGLCVMESLACAVPVLISPHVNLAPEIEAASAGWIAEVNEAAIEQALAAALSSKAERRTRGGNGKQLALKYAWPNIANQLRQVYGELALHKKCDHGSTQSVLINTVASARDRVL
jgi:glycosyltransferase involved in cell wall biosynthesis